MVTTILFAALAYVLIMRAAMMGRFDDVLQSTAACILAAVGFLIAWAL